MKAVVSLSGGMDSATVLGEAIARDREVIAVSFEYGSKHNSYEGEAACSIAAHYHVPFHHIDLTSAMAGFKSNLMLSGGAIPEGHYEQANMELTVVPMRNMIFLSLLAGFAWSNDANEVWMGMHAGDHLIYPDCRPAFVDAANKAIQEGSDMKVSLITPYLKIFKKDILERGLLLGVPYILTRTCYKNQEVACGKCGSCQERLEAFSLLGLSDPLLYHSRELLPKEKAK